MDAVFEGRELIHADRAARMQPPGSDADFGNTENVRDSLNGHEPVLPSEKRNAADERLNSGCYKCSAFYSPLQATTNTRL